MSARPHNSLTGLAFSSKTSLGLVRETIGDYLLVAYDSFARGTAPTGVWVNELVLVPIAQAVEEHWVFEEPD